MVAILIPSDLEAGILARVPGVAGNFGGFWGQRGENYLALVCGIGEANAAAAVGFLVGRFSTRRVLLLGIGGAYPGSGLNLGNLVLASEEIHADLGLAKGGMAALGFPALVVSGQTYYNSFPASPWSKQLATALGLPMAKFLTRDRVSESALEARRLADYYGAEIENMEGAGAFMAAIRLGVEIAEIRSVANPAGLRERDKWDLRGAFSALQMVLEQVLALE